MAYIPIYSFKVWLVKFFFSLNGFFLPLDAFPVFIFQVNGVILSERYEKLSYELIHRTARISWSNNGLPEGFETYFHAFIFSCKQKLVPKPSAMTYPRIVSYRLKSHLQSLCTPALKTCLNSNDCTSPLYLRTDFLADLNWWQADAKIGSTRV